MYFEIIGFTIGTIGKLLIAYAALRVHERVLNDRKIDGAVFRIMKRERHVGLIGAAFILLGYGLELLPMVGLI